MKKLLMLVFIFSISACTPMSVQPEQQSEVAPAEMHAQGVLIIYTYKKKPHYYFVVSPQGTTGGFFSGISQSDADILTSIFNNEDYLKYVMELTSVTPDECGCIGAKLYLNDDIINAIQRIKDHG